ncbi:MAG: M61 family metallopeptidase [Persicimonas sp.]
MSATIRFTVAAPNPHDHLYRVTMEIEAVGEDDHLDLSMPVWSPGSYLVREYARHVQNLQATDEDGSIRTVEKTDKATWRVDTTHTRSITIEYEVFAHDLNVRANHLDDTHGFFTGVALYLYPHGRRDEQVEVEVVPPPDFDWQVYTGLEQLSPKTNRYGAPDFDVLFDTPVEMGDHTTVEFTVDEVPHRMVFSRRGNYDTEALEEDLPRVVRANRDIFGDLPYDDYLFITLISDGSRGGLEHLNSTALIYPHDRFLPSEDDHDTDDGYLDFLRLVCHEHFHAWNVKRIRPERLGPFDYQRENYTRDLWTVEGVTSYYDTLGLLRAGLIDAKGYLKRFLERIKRLERTPGRHLHSLEEASFDAWIKLYRKDEHTRNSSVSYYLKGELVCALLDLRIRRESGGDRSMDDVLRYLWQHHSGPRGYPEGGYEKIVTEATGVELGDFFARYIRGTDPIRWNEELASVGLKLEREVDEKKAWLGVRTKSSKAHRKVTFVPTDSPAHRHGIYAGDEIVAIDGWKVTRGGLSKHLRDKRPGDSVDVHVFRGGELRRCRVELGEPRPDTYRVLTRDDADEESLELLEGWIGADGVKAEI